MRTCAPMELKHQAKRSQGSPGIEACLVKVAVSVGGDDLEGRKDLLGRDPEVFRGRKHGIQGDEDGGRAHGTVACGDGVVAVIDLLAAPENLRMSTSIHVSTRHKDRSRLPETALDCLQTEVCSRSGHDANQARMHVRG